MNFMSIFVRRFLLWGGLVLWSGCSMQQNWLIGKWQVDTEESATATFPPAEDGTPGLLGFGNLLTSIIQAQLEDATVEFTSSEMRIRKGESGQAFQYKIIERPDAQTIVIQDEDGQITTYHRDGERIWFSGSGFASRLKVYLKPAP